MQHPGFFHRAGPFTLKDIATASGATVIGEDERTIDDVRPLQSATERDVSFFENRKYAALLGTTRAGACILSARDVAKAPEGISILTSDSPYTAFARVLTLFYADALRSKAAASSAHGNGALVHASANIAENATIEPGAVVGREAVIGEGTVIAAGAVVGYRVVIGKDCYIGPGATVTHAILGDGVIIHSGARIGQDGFGFAMSAKGHLKVPQIGRVLIGDAVEIGANTTVDRGSLADTIIGDGTKIDNLVQIAHNVVIGKHCVIVAQSGIAGSAEIGDFVIMGAHSGVIGHVKVGSGAQIAGSAHVKDDVEPGARMGGTPARPFKEWAREIAAIRQLAKKS
ncbi:MAG: UDP-3-O-(3-hydroxymyristoyl)glucosamine N-acyltransferase [Hyphomicrobium sp. 32-62-53]|nr:MAG: UDP-3-O-(3-hydroxymyristoyl)glucosamine N-acyltransferase [Hyphomicrobium sp. 12-62-95]OYY00597.1 MAG: UDP-3-O-(3-hydroxymyristoyl)glucosamine N-acyltransferase [Hyphomicrobium sp. 32-62-53]